MIGSILKEVRIGCKKDGFSFGLLHISSLKGIKQKPLRELALRQFCKTAIMMDFVSESKAVVL